jgi:hypothetical protein
MGKRSSSCFALVSFKFALGGEPTSEARGPAMKWWRVACTLSDRRNDGNQLQCVFSAVEKKDGTKEPG